VSLQTEIRALVEAKVERANGRDFYRKPLVGFSSAADPLYATFKEVVGPHHLLPEEVLPGVATLVSFFVPFSRMVVDANRRERDVPAREWVDSYAHANDLIDEIGGEMAAMLEAGGVRAGMVNSTNNYDETILKAPWSHRSAAFVAGLGRFGLNRMLITPVGAAGRFGTVFLAEALPPSPRSEEERCLFFRDGSCGYCRKCCPAQALGRGPDGFDRHACNRRLLDVTPYSRSLGWELDVCGKCDVGPCAVF
jgi:Uncharacterized Fe-S protein